MKKSILISTLVSTNSGEKVQSTDLVQKIHENAVIMFQNINSHLDQCYDTMPGNY